MSNNLGLILIFLVHRLSPPSWEKEKGKKEKYLKTTREEESSKILE